MVKNRHAMLDFPHALHHPPRFSQRHRAGYRRRFDARGAARRRGCAQGLLRDIGVDIARFETAFDRGFYSSLGLSRGVFFDRETFGRDTLLADDPLLAQRTEAEALAAFVAAMPLADLSKQQLLSLYDPARDPLAGRSAEEKLRILKTMSYRDYLIKL